MDITMLRPTDFDQMVGNTTNINHIKNFLRYTFPKFSIILGSEGIGKTTVSKIIAKSLTCPQRINGLPCNVCDTCLEVDRELIGQNKDCFHIKTFKMSDEGGKRAAREIKEYIRMRIPKGKTKIIILEECQGLSLEAQDLLLPELEYIPDNTKIIALTTNERVLQGTFKSRAVIFRFKVPPKAETITLLADVCHRLGVEVVGSRVLPIIVEYANAKPRTALNTLHKLLGQGNRIDIHTINSLLNIADEMLYLEYLNILRGDMGLTLDFITKLDEQEVALTDFVVGLNKFLVTLLTLRYRKIDMTEDLLKECKKLLSTYDDQDLLKIQSIVATEAPQIENETFARYQLVALTFKLMNRNNSQLLENGIKNAARVEQEKDMAVKNQLAELAKEERRQQEVSIDLMSNPNALLKDFQAFRIDANPNKKD